MRRVEQREGTVGAGLRRRVVAQVRGEEGVHAGRADVVEEAVAGAAAHGDRADRRLRVAGHPDALRGGGQPGGGQVGELSQRQRTVQFADPAQAAAARRVGGVRHQGPYDTQAERAGEGVGDAGVGGVGVGVGDVQGDVVLDQGVHDPALEGGRRHGRRTAQIERVVGDEQVGAQFHRLVDDLPHGIDGEQDPRDLLVGVARDGADRVPGLGPLGGPQVLQRGDDFRQTGHGCKATCLIWPSVQP
ncbi:hypothetical protein GCM10020256_54750 [Streptomyces thermocoprophilus]